MTNAHTLSQEIGAHVPQWTSPLHELYPDQPGECDGCTTPSQFRSVRAEYDRLRNGVGLVDHSYYGKFRVSGPAALDVVNKVALSDIAQIPIMKIAPSYMLTPDGRPMCELYTANVGDGYLLLTDGAPPAQVYELFQQTCAASPEVVTLTDMTRSLTLTGVYGPFAWELMKDLIGIKILGVRYMDMLPEETIGDTTACVLRAGKMAEFGYLLATPASAYPALLNHLLAAGHDYDLMPCGFAAYDLCRLEDRFINMRREGAQARNVLELNCRIMVRRDKGDYRGRAAVAAALEQGITQRLIGVAAPPETLPEAAAATLSGAAILAGDTPIGYLAHAAYSPTLERAIGVAFIEARYAFVGMDYSLEMPDARLPMRTVSAPFILNRSLTIRPQEDSYLDCK